MSDATNGFKTNKLLKVHNWKPEQKYQLSQQGWNETSQERHKEENYKSPWQKVIHNFICRK